MAAIVIVLLIILAALFLAYYRFSLIAMRLMARNGSTYKFYSGRSLQELKDLEFSFPVLQQVKLKIAPDKRGVVTTAPLMPPQLSSFHKKTSKATAIDGEQTGQSHAAIQAPDLLHRRLHLPNSPLQQQLALAFDAPGTHQYRSLAAMVVKNGHVIGEHFAGNIQAGTPMLSWSLVKSMWGILSGMAIKQKVFTLHDPLDLPAWVSDRRKHITLEHLLHMTSGLKWQENYRGYSNVTRMLFQETDAFSYSLSRKLRHAPGTHWQYASCNTNMISGWLRLILADDIAYHAYPYRHLFEKLGMTSALHETDGAGNFIASSYLYASTMDYARFGQFCLEAVNGRYSSWLPSGWMDYIRTPVSGSRGTYGAHFWLNRDNSFPDLPGNMFYARGFQGQRIFIFPDEDMVIVRLGYSPKNTFDFNYWVRKWIDSA